MRTAAASFVALVTLIPGGRALADDAPAELRGRWELVSIEAEGQPLPIRGDSPRVEIVGDKVRYGGETFATLVADPGATPRSIDLHLLDPMRTLEGIYAVEKDTLKVCVNRQIDGVKERPHVLSTRGKGSWRLLTFRRAAEGGDDAGRGFIGLALSFDKDTKAVVVQETLPDSPAAKAGLKKGDVVLAVAGAEVASMQAAIEAVRASKPGGMLALRVRRDGEPKDLQIRVALIPFVFLADLG